MPYKDPAKAAECKRRWAAENKEKTRASSRAYCYKTYNTRRACPRCGELGHTARTCEAVISPERLLEIERIKEERRERNREYQKRRYAERKAEYAAANAEYRETERGQQVACCASWRFIGVICDDWEALYERYKATTRCEFCKAEFGTRGDGTGTFKCLDHDHETGEVRGIICHTCNARDVLQ